MRATAGIHDCLDVRGVGLRMGWIVWTGCGREEDNPGLWLGPWRGQRVCPLRQKPQGKNNVEEEI